MWEWGFGFSLGLYKSTLGRSKYNYYHNPMWQILTFEFRFSNYLLQNISSLNIMLSLLLILLLLLILCLNIMFMFVNQIWVIRFFRFLLQCFECFICLNSFFIGFVSFFRNFSCNFWGFFGRPLKVFYYPKTI